ncbi:MAG: AEC family transporter [Clostridiales bacterium]|nr:AEC family transporter [Clostridiales bacterium]
MNFLLVLKQVVTLFLMMSVGFALKKLKIMTSEVKSKLSDILIWVVTPCAIISAFSVEYSAERIGNIITVFVAAVIGYAVALLLCLLFFKKQPVEKKGVYRFCMVFGNAGFMGFPVLQSIFGSDGIFYGSIFVVVFHIAVWTVGVSMLRQGRSRKEILKHVFVNPGVISVAVGIVLFVFKITLPSFLAQAIDSFGSMNTPLSMLIIGSIFADTNLKEIFLSWRLYIVSLFKLVVIPLIMLALVKVFNMSGIATNIAIIECGMPTAALSAILAVKFSSDAKTAMGAVAVATLLSIVTIPFIVWLL